MANSGYWLVAGWLSEAELTESTAAIENFAIQADQDTGRIWQRPDNEADMVSPVGEFVDSIDFQRGGYGGAESKFKMRMLSPKMVNYLWTNLFGQAYSAQVTVRQFNRSTGEFETRWYWAQWPDVRSQAELAGGGYDLFEINLLDGVLAADGPDMTLAKNHTGTPTLNENLTFTITATNDGDGATFANVVVVETLGDDLSFASTTAAGWTIEYSTNDGGAYQSEVPVPPNTVTNVRYTYTAVLDAGEAAPAITLVAAPIDEGTVSNTATVTTTGDTDTDNNTATDTFEVNLVSDNQPAFMKGAATATDSQAAYLSGV